MPHHVPTWTRTLLLAVAAVGSVPLAAQQPDGVVEGRVLGPHGEPLPNVEVLARAEPRAGARLGAARTDGEGVFRLARLPTDRAVAVTASLPGHTTAVGEVTFEPGSRQTGLTLRLWQANTVRGRVVDPTGKPIVGAAVLGTKDRTQLDGSFVPPEAITDAAGAFELAGVPIGDCVIRAWMDGFELREQALQAVADATIEVTLAPGRETLLSIYVRGAPQGTSESVLARVTGTRSGAAIALPGAIERARLDGKGHLVLAGLPRAEYQVALEAPGYRFDPPRATTPNGRFTHVLPFVATAVQDLTLRGTLCGPDGAPLAGQRLVVRPARGAPGPAVVTDAEGRFALTTTMLRGESYDLFLTGSPWVLQQPRPAGTADLFGTCWHEFADPDRELSLVAAPSAYVVVRLLREDRKPAAFTRAQLQRHYPNVTPAWHRVADVTSARDGTLDFGGLRGGPTRLRVHVAGEGGSGDSEEFTLDAGERTTLDVVLAPVGTVHGRLLDRTGAPVPGARLALTNWDLDARAQSDTNVTCVLTDRDGRFVFRGVVPGGHRVETGRYEPSGEAGSAPFVVEPAGEAELELRLTK